MQENLYPVRAIASKHVAAASKCLLQIGVIRVAKEQKKHTLEHPGVRKPRWKQLVNRGQFELPHRAVSQSQS